MKIAQIAPVWERVPPIKYGGTELIVYLLTEELVRRGYDVTLFATGDSITSARLESVYPKAPSRELLGHPVPDLLHVTVAYKRASEFDIIHNHAGYSGVALANFVSPPVLTTLHGIFTEINIPFYRTFKDAVYYNSISEAQRKVLPELNYIGTVYNAIDVPSFPFSERKKDYYIYISRMSPLKAPHLAVEVARKAGIKLIMAGKIDPGKDMVYFEEKVKPYIDGDQIKFLGEITEDEKKELLKYAKGFVFSLQWPEPFGLVMAEAMACGTPVIAFPFGSVPEVVMDKETGFIVNTLDEMGEAVAKVDQIDPLKCRRYVEERFSVSRMVDDYESIYRKMLSKK
ncbi:MAG: glycosyltransferase family 4 protein [Actinomycetota bacterium]|nr:glycosyltransferase family 4 protein [Actinomycetota bacterium]MDI6821884.1 glycosyltransferase family 4 protein [Actinomycetota bacterium]